jgi:hypothetical protein
MATDRPARETDAENCEIEITPEMIEAGEQELMSFDRRFEAEEDLVIRIYRSMESARYLPKSSSL